MALELTPIDMERPFTMTKWFLPDTYAIIWAMNGSGRLSCYDPSTQIWTDKGSTTLPDESVLGSYSMDINNNTNNPLLVYQRNGGLYTAPLDDPTNVTFVGSHNNPAFTGSYPCGAFRPGTEEYWIGIGSGSSVAVVDLITGEATTLGNLIDVRDGNTLIAGPGDWFFDPEGNLFLMARDQRGASFGESTGTVLWQIDPNTLETTRIGKTDAPSSGTGAAWLAPGTYLLSASNRVYTYRPALDSEPGSTVAWQQDIPNAPHTINDLGNQWVVPCPTEYMICYDKNKDGTPNWDNAQYWKLIQDEDDPNLHTWSEGLPTLPGRWDEPNKSSSPFILDPVNPSSGGSDVCTDEVWHEGCSAIGNVKWRRTCDGAWSYIYGSDSDPTSVRPNEFIPFECDTFALSTDTQPFCNGDLDPPQTIYRKERSDGTITWFDETGTISEPVNKEPGECPQLDNLLPVTQQVICYDDGTGENSYVRVVKEQYVENTDGSTELLNYQIIFYNEDGTLYDSGALPAADSPVGEPVDWYIGECVNRYVRTEDIRLCEIDARYLLLIDSSGRFARYSFLTREWTNVSTLSVSSAGGSADVENFLLYNFVAPDQITVIDVNTDTQLSNLTVVDGIINPAATANPKTFSAAAFRDSDGKLYAWDTAGADAGLYCVSVNGGVGNGNGTATVDFVTTVSGVSGTGTSIAIDNTTDRLIINGSSNAYETSFVDGTSVVWDTPPIRANGSTFDDQGNFYVSEGNNTYCRNATTGVWTQIIDDWTPGANSIAFYRVEAPKPSCFTRRYGYLAPDGQTKECIGDFYIGTKEDIERTIVGEVVCCDDPSISSSSGSGEVFVTNDPVQTLCDGSEGYFVQNTLVPITYWELEGSTGGLRRRDWSDVLGTGGSFSNAQLTAEVGNDFTANFDTSITPTSESLTYASLNTNDIDNTAIVSDYQKIEGTITLNENALFRWIGASEGYFKLELGLCCGPLKTILSYVHPTAPETPVLIPTGTHNIVLHNLDMGGTNSSQSSQISFDGGQTWSNVLSPFIEYSFSKPTWKCKDGWLCSDGVYIDLNGDPLTFSKTLVRHLPECNAISSDSSDDSNTEEVVYDTSFSSEFLSSAFTVPTFPANTKEVSIHNLSNAYIEIDTSEGTQIVPPNGTIEFSVYDYEAGMSANSMSILQGNFNGNSRIVFNYRMTS